MKTRSYLLHALSPLHAGTGQAVGVIDLPIMRMRSTGIPIVPGSSIKGVLRDKAMPGADAADRFAVFGPDNDGAAEHAGALIVGDARLLALPVRSFKGTFAWVTSPLLLDLARRDMENVRDVPAALPAVDRRQAAVAALDGETASLNAHRRGKTTTVFLEDLDFSVAVRADVLAWATFLAPFVAPAGQTLLFARRLVVVDDESMGFLWDTATQIDTRVRIAPDTRTVAQGALWTEESLPPETLLIGILAAEPERRRRNGSRLDAAAVLAHVLPEKKETTLQFGGKATIGRGRCRMVPLGPEVEA